MYTVTNTLENAVLLETASDKELVEFTQKIAIENEDYDFSILGASDAIEYIEDYCDNLSISEQ